MDRPNERRGSPPSQEERKEEARVAERLERGPAEPDADGPDGARLLGGRPRRIEQRERDQHEARGRERHDPLHLAEPAIAAPRPARARPRVDLLLGRDQRGHQTSTTIGSTTGFRRNRWAMKWRTAVRT